MKLHLTKALCFVVIFVMTPMLHANAPKVGRSAAAKYFQKNPEQEQQQVGRYMASEVTASGNRYMSFGFNSYTKSDSYSWGNINRESNIAKWGLDMSYRLSKYNDLVDYSLRVSYNEFEPTGQKANKLSFLYAATLPDVDSRFPLYFGVAAGVGVFFTQLPSESPVTLDYQLFGGVRLFEILENTGFYIEGGLKNHLQLTSDGQLNGTYISGGAVFSF